MTRAVSLPPVVVAFVSALSEGSPNTVYRSVWLKIPSGKIAAHLAIVGTPNDGYQGVGFAAAAHWQLTPYVAATEARGTRPAPLTPIFADCDGTETPRPLPGGYEIQSCVRLWRARLKLLAAPYSYTDDDGTALTQTGYGTVVASCTLEPAPETCLTDAEFQTLVGQCELWLDGQPAGLVL